MKRYVIFSVFVLLFFVACSGLQQGPPPIDYEPTPGKRAIELDADSNGAIDVNRGGTNNVTMTDGGVLLGSGTGAITAMPVLSDGEMIVGDGTTDPVAESGATLRTSIGVGTTDSPQFTGINLGHASDTTLARSGAGDITVEGNHVYRAGGTDVADTDVVDTLTITSITQVQDIDYGGATAFTDEDTTPNVGTKKIAFYKTANTGDTTITDLDDGTDHTNLPDGAIRIILVQDDATNVDFTSSQMSGNGGADKSLSDQDILICVFDDTADADGQWLCIISSQDAGESYLSELSEDTSPQLGGDLDLNGHSITGVGSVQLATKNWNIQNAAGVHDGDNNAAIMTDSGETFTADAYIGLIIYNITDGSSCTVTDNDGTTITCTLSGGTDSDWDTNDVWQVGPPGPGGFLYITSTREDTCRLPTVASPYGYNFYVEETAAQTLHIDVAAADRTVYEGTALSDGDKLSSDGSAGEFAVFNNNDVAGYRVAGHTPGWTDGN